MNDDGALLTVAIPTRNRAMTALRTAQCAAVLGPQVDVVVQDCSDTRELEQALLRDPLPNVRYFHTGRAVSMTENWNLAIGNATGEYVVIIGDDDGVTPDALAIARWAHDNDIDAVSQKRLTAYFHSDFPVPTLAGLLIVPDYSGALEQPDLNAELLRASFKTGELISGLPRLYHGMIRRRPLMELFARNGRFLDGTSPDYYTPYAVGAIIKRFAVVDFPFTIAGASGQSNTARHLTGRLHLHQREFGRIQWPKGVPDVYCVRTSIAESMCKALRDVGRTDLTRNIDWRRLYATCFYVQPHRARAIWRQYSAVMREQGKNRTREAILLAAMVVAKAPREVRSRSKRTLVKNYLRYGELTRDVADIGDAAQRVPSLARRSAGNPSWSAPRDTPGQ